MRTSLFAAVAATSLVGLSAGTQAADCLRGDRIEARATAAVQRTDHMLKRVGDGIMRTGDRLFGWMLHRRPRI